MISRTYILEYFDQNRMVDNVRWVGRWVYQQDFLHYNNAKIFMKRLSDSYGTDQVRIREVSVLTISRSKVMP